MKNQDRRQLPNIRLPDAVPLLLTLATGVLQAGLLVVVVEQVLERAIVYV